MTGAREHSGAVNAHMGFVYVFNGVPQPIRLALASGLVGPIQPPAATGSAPYSPFSIQVQRVTAPYGGTAPAFIDGQTNDVTVETQGLNQEQAQLPVPAVGDGTDDLWLYVFSELLLLIQTDGRVCAQVPTKWNASFAQFTSEGC